MSQRNLEDYIPVKERKHQFYISYPDGRIVPDLIENSEEKSVFKVSCFKTVEDQTKNLPLATGFAQEIKGQGGFANKTSWLENCEESAVGRCLDNAGFSVSKTCSREEIIAANRNAAAAAEEKEVKKKYAKLIFELAGHDDEKYKEEIEKAKKMTIKQMAEKMHYTLRVVKWLT